MPYMVIVGTQGRERDCRKLVKDRGFPCYMPTFKERVIVRGRKVWNERLLFGRYFFAKWSDGCDWRALYQLRHAEDKILSGIFMQRPDIDQDDRTYEPTPALVQDNEIERIRASEDDHGHVSNPISRGFIKGQKIRASGGLLAGITGVYVGTGKGDCDVALLELLGRETRIEFRPGVLQAA